MHFRPTIVLKKKKKQENILPKFSPITNLFLEKVSFRTNAESGLFSISKIKNVH